MGQMIRRRISSQIEKMMIVLSGTVGQRTRRALRSMLAIAGLYPKL